MNIGLGAKNAKIHFYIANRPPFEEYSLLQCLQALKPGELDYIVAHSSNHWRKVFNVYAKLLHAWYSSLGLKDLPETWQEYRDTTLFQSHSDEALLFSPPRLSEVPAVFHIVAGKTYASRLNLPELQWHNRHFASHAHSKLIVAPYPDYRQLSNARIEELIELMQSFRLKELS